MSVYRKCVKFFDNEKIEVLVNCGGNSMRELFEDTSFSVCESMMNVNCTSHMAVIKACIPGLIKRKKGMIVNIVSVQGLFPNPCRTMYVAAKFGITGFAKAIRPELADHGIHVLNIYPGYIATNISKNALTGDGSKFGKVDENNKTGMPVEKCSAQIMKAMARRRTEVIVDKKAINQLAPLISLSETLCGKFQRSQFKKNMEAKEKAE